MHNTSVTTEKVIKVSMSIPTEGHTLPEAYDNHLLHSFRLGVAQQTLKYQNEIVTIREILKKYLTPSKFKLASKEIESKLVPFGGVKYNKVRYEFYWYTAGRLLTQMAREKLVRESLVAGMDFIIMYDDDMILPLDMALMLLEDMQKHSEIDVVAPLAFMRNPPHYAVSYNVIEGYDGERHLPYYINTFDKYYPKDCLVEADAVGFGAVCIRMDMVRKMKDPYFMSTTNTGEDIWFCVKARKEAKARIFMDTRIKLGHLAKPQIIDETYYEKWIKDNKHDLGIKPNPKYSPLEKRIEEQLVSGEISHKSISHAK